MHLQFQYVHEYVAKRPALNMTLIAVEDKAGPNIYVECMMDISDPGNAMDINSQFWVARACCNRNSFNGFDCQITGSARIRTTRLDPKVHLMWLLLIV